MISSYQRRDCSTSPSMEVNTRLRPPVAGLVAQAMSTAVANSAAERLRSVRIPRFVAASYAAGRGCEAAPAECGRSAGSAGCGRRLVVLAAELVDATGRIEHLLLARIERVAGGADFDLKILPQRRTRLERVAAAAGHGDLGVFGVGIGFHG